MKWLMIVGVISHLFVIEPITVDELKDVKEAGTYPVEMYTYDQNGQAVKEVVMITIKHPHTIINGNEAIDADDLRMTWNDFEKMNDDEWKVQANAKAWNTLTGDEVEVVVVDVELVVESQSYKVYFQTSLGTKTSIEVTIVKEPIDAESFNEMKVKPLEEGDIFRNVGLTVAILAGFPVMVLTALFFVYRGRQHKIRRWLFNKKDSSEVTP